MDKQKSETMKKINKMDIKQLCQSLERISSMELSEFFGGGIHYYVDSRGNIEKYSGDQYLGYYIYCGNNKLEIGGPLDYASQDGKTFIMNGSYAIFTFLADNTSVEYGYFCKTDSEHPLENSKDGFVITSGDEREGHLGYPVDSDYNTQIHSHPRSDRSNGSGPSDGDKEHKEEQQNEEGNTITIFGVYNPYDHKIIYY